MVVELVSRARSGDAEAYTELVRRFQDAVYATAYQAVLDPEAARDLAQDTFVRAYEALGSLRDPASFPGWVVRICRNLAASWLRRPDRAWVSIDGLHVPAPDVAPLVASDDVVTRALAALPEENRLALSLFVVDGYTYDEVARLTGTTTAAVRGRIHRAKRKLAAEVFGMVEESVKAGAPDETFTVRTVEESLERASTLLGQQRKAEARAAAEEALAALDRLECAEEEKVGLRRRTVSAVRAATFLVDSPRYIEATREHLRLCEETGDTEGLAHSLQDLAYYGHVPEPEKEALIDRAMALFRSLGRSDRVAQDICFRGWDRLLAGDPDEATALFGRARDLLRDEPYCVGHALLAAYDLFFDLCDRAPDLERGALWRAQGMALAPEKGRIVPKGSLANNYYGGTHRDWALCGEGFGSFWFWMWLPRADVPSDLVEEFPTFSHTGNPTVTRLWVETGVGPVSTPAGEFRDCLLVRSTTRESPKDEGTESKQRGFNRMWCGERSLWLARGVGPVEYRHERFYGPLEHCILTRFECPQRDDAWVPLTLGTRWEWSPVNAPAGFQATAVRQIVYVAEDQAYTAHAIYSLRPEA
ncbi:MAG: sigma-70 family RNA polymerase sigma factor [Armatimonadetes bacterium]|nr:sigma-70 family RNA polymerase sigma factor [Armatimonadota bacterium]